MTKRLLAEIVKRWSAITKIIVKTYLKYALDDLVVFLLWLKMLNTEEK